jgi:uncharacterized protein YcaQ
MTLEELRRFTVARNFFPPTSLRRALQRMGFVQADPIRAPARAQDLILRHRVRDYRAGDLERRYATLDIDEDVFINYGFVTRSLQKLMHPRTGTAAHGVFASDPRSKLSQGDREQLLLGFVREHGEVHPRQVDEHFSHGTMTNYWGGSSNATTHLLELMHYRGLLRVARREKGIRVYAVHEHDVGPEDGAERDARIDALVDTVVDIYAPLSSSGLSYYLRRLRFAAPQWSAEMTAALNRAKERLTHARVDGVDWYWAERKVNDAAQQEIVRLLAPFDPLVHDRARFELLWGWAYRLEAYTPLAKRKLGYYALPLLWRENVIGWANLSTTSGVLKAEFGFVKAKPRERAFKREVEAELNRMGAFLKLEG